MNVRIIENPTHTVDIMCGECKGTGLYVGFSEPPKTAAVCQDCKGTGNFQFQYKPFEARQLREGIAYVVKAGVRYSIEEFLDNKIPDVNDKQWVPPARTSDDQSSIVINPALK